MSVDRQEPLKTWVCCPLVSVRASDQPDCATCGQPMLRSVDDRLRYPAPHPMERRALRGASS